VKTLQSNENKGEFANIADLVPLRLAMKKEYYPSKWHGHV
jgi:hypothetical protein